MIKNKIELEIAELLAENAKSIIDLVAIGIEEMAEMRAIEIAKNARLFAYPGNKAILSLHLCDVDTEHQIEFSLYDVLTFRSVTDCDTESKKALADLLREIADKIVSA